MTRSEVSKERADHYDNTRHKWVVRIPKKRFKQEIASIDDMLEHGDLSLDVVLRSKEQFVGAVVPLRYLSKLYFERRIKKWYPDAAKEYKAYIKTLP